MDRKEVLELAMAKAQNNGWNKHFEITVVKHDYADQYWVAFYSTYQSINHDIEWVLYNHEFAEAIWGKEWPEDILPKGFTTNGEIPYYKVMLQNMVIAEDAIHFLGENL